MDERRESNELTHVDRQGRARMVDVGQKPTTRRIATAAGRVVARPDTVRMIATGSLAKGDVIATARIAGISAAKRTWELIPLCHNISLAEVAVDIEPDPEHGLVEVTARSVAVDRTGVEMEALTAVAVACLTIYDMCKAVDRRMVIEGVRLLSKSGGSSGDWQREPEGGSDDAGGCDHGQ